MGSTQSKWRRYRGLFRFVSDSVLIKNNNNITYRALSTYKESGSSFTIVDIDPNLCLGDTGKYTFNITNDTLIFTINQDLCFPRSGFFSNNILIKLLTTGIHSEKEQEIVNPVYPNPTNGQITVPPAKKEAIFSIIDQTSKVILRGEFKTIEQNLDLSKFPKGIYYLKSEEGQIKTQKIIKL